MNRRALTILFLCLSLIFGGICFLNLEFQSHYSSFGLSDDSFQEEYIQLADNFEIDNSVQNYILVLERETGFRDYDDFKLLDKITKDLSSMEIFESVSSLTSIIVPKKGIIGYTKKVLFDVSSESSFLKSKGTLNSLNDLTQKFINDQRNIALIYCTPQNNDILFPIDYLEQLDKNEVSFEVINLADDLGSEDPVISETITIALIVLLVVLATFFFFTKSLLGLLISIGFIGANLGLTFIAQYFLGIPFSIAMVGVPSIVIILSFSDLMHVFYLQSKYRDDCDSDDALRLMIKKKIRVPMFLTSLTNLIGLLVILGLSRTTHLSELALISLIGIVIAYLNSRFILISFIKRKRHYINPRKIDGLKGSLSHKLIPIRKGIILTSVSISILLTIVLVKNYQVGFSLENYKSSNQKLDQNRTQLANEFFGNKSIEVLVEYANEEDMWSFRNQVQLEKAEKLIRKTFQPKYTSCVNNLVRRYNFIESFGHEEAFRLRESLKSSDIEMIVDKLGGGQIVSKDNRMSKIRFGFSSNSLTNDLLKYDALEKGLGKIKSKGIKFRLFSKTVESDRAIEYYSIRILIGLLFGILSAAIIMGIVKKSIILGFGTLLVNIIPVLFGACLMLSMNIQINPQSLFLLSILVGVCLDDSIYLSGYTRSNSRNLMIFPLFVTSFVLGLGFLGLFFSSYPWIRDFSIIFVVGILSAFLLDMFVYPLFMKIDQSE